MPFHLHTGNRLDRLADRLAEVVRAPLASVFTPEMVVVQSLGMARWLKLELARRLGVCARMEFPFPRAFTDRLSREMLPAVPAGESFRREVVQWRLFRLLGALPETADFAAPRRYLDGGDARKRLQLAARLANLFDQYSVFRPGHIAAWDAGRPAGPPPGTGAAHPDEAWQAGLWRAVVAETGPAHPASVHTALLAALAGPAPAGLPERITLFGMSALPPAYLEVFAALARHRDVHCFLLQPCAEWWGDLTTGREAERVLRRLGRRAGDAPDVHLEEGHRLLGSLGTLGRDFLKLIYEHADPVEETDFVAPAPATLLGGIQRDLLELRGAADGDRSDRVVAATDDSVRVHVCHSPLRELEVLHDHLLDWFQRDPTLTPRDVLVMTPDLAKYSPLVQAVFGSPEDGTPSIPFSLADRGPRQSGQITDTFLGILRLAHGRLGVTSVLDLLEKPAVRARFGFGEADLPKLRHWIAETRIHWGRDAGHRAALGLPATETNTWRAGLRRLLLGYAMRLDDAATSEAGAEESGGAAAVPSAGGAGSGAPGAAGHAPLFAGILPYDDIEGGDALLLGKFAEFADRLFGAVGALEQEHTPAGWTPLLTGVVDGFFLADGDTASELAVLRRTIDGLGRDRAAAAVTASVALGVLLEPLSAALDDDSSGAGFLTGGVTFCALKPMRSIPFRVICLLGMDDGAFPRQAPHLGFDLMAAHPMLGDRSTRDDDRYLFLETLVSARDRLHLSHVGQSQRDNRPIPPSVVVGGLRDHIDAAVVAEDGQGSPRENGLVVKHRLHAFSPAYFSAGPESPLFSYSRENCATAAIARGPRSGDRRFIAAPLAGSGPERRQVALQQLAGFLAHPARFFLRERLGIELPREEAALEDDEPLALDPRGAYGLKQDLVAWLLAGRDPGRFFDEVEAQGRLPHGQVGALGYRDIQAAAVRFRARIGDTASAAPVAVDLAIDGFTLTGRLAPRVGGGPLHFRCARLKAVDRLRLWVEHLAWQLAAPDAAPEAIASSRCESLLVAEDATVRFRPVPHADAVLRDLLALYWSGLQEPLRFFPRTSLAFVEAERKAAAGKSRSKRTPLEQSRTEWVGSERPPLPGEGDDAWLKLCFGRDDDPLDDEFQELSRRILGPMLEHTVEEDGA